MDKPQLTPLSAWLYLGAIFCAAALIGLLLTGCASNISGISVAGKGVAAADAYRKAAISQADAPKAVRTILGDEHQGKALREADAAITAAEAERGALAARYAALEGRWYVKAGQSFEWIAGSVLVLWALAGLTGVGLSLATGGASVAAGTIFKFLPFANVFTWLVARRTK